MMPGVCYLMLHVQDHISTRVLQHARALHAECRALQVIVVRRVISIFDAEVIPAQRQQILRQEEHLDTNKSL